MATAQEDGLGSQVSLTSLRTREKSKEHNRLDLSGPTICCRPLITLSNPNGEYVLQTLQFLDMVW